MNHRRKPLVFTMIHVNWNIYSAWLCYVHGPCDIYNQTGFR